MILEKVQETKAFLAGKIPENPDVMMVLGSGLGGIANLVENPTRISYSQIPNFVKSTVSGHRGELVSGKLFDKNVIIMQGRLHYYEGYTLKEVTFPMRLMAALGVKTIVLTSAVGGINRKYGTGDIVFINDHINFTGNNPLIGAHENGLGERFPDIANVYTKEYRKIMLAIAKKEKITAYEGVYIAVSGPSYETPAEIKAYRKLGGDVVGMSVAPEAIVCGQSGLKLVCASYVTNMASGVNNKVLSHQEVMEMGSKAALKMELLLTEFFKKI